MKHAMNFAKHWLLLFLLSSTSADSSSCETETSSLIQRLTKQQDTHDDAMPTSPVRTKGEGLLPFNQHLQEARPRELLMPARIARDWASQRDLAKLGPVKKFFWTPEENHTYEFLFFSAIPTFGDDGNYIALLHDLWADSNPDDFLLALKKFPLYCSGADRKHKSPVTAYGWDHGEKGTQVSVNLLCQWPESDKDLEKFEVFLEDAKGKAIGSMVADHKPTLFQKKYGTAACVREVFLTNQSNAPLKLLPEWMEFHVMHGVEHFFIYTFDDTDPGMEAVMTPYINSGLATRIHFNQYPERHVRHHRLMTDCLFRAKNRATWLMPTIDTDEYLHVDPTVFKGQDTPKDYLNTAWDAVIDHFQANRSEVYSLNFELYRFSRSPRNLVEISSMFREEKNNKNNEGRSKFVVNVHNVHGLWIHFPTNWNEGTYAINVPKQLLYGNHYRYEDHILYGQKDPTANIRDQSLAGEVQPLMKALEKRFGEEPRQLLERLSYLSPLQDVEIRRQRSKGRNKLDALDEWTFQQDEDRKRAAVARQSDNTGGAALYKELPSKLARLLTMNYLST
mmetsp:Transcript_14752/g.32558  ORF Transcript_14752/g.32558 Transcript_14752/m.32558 type:complete len:563 (-) Transcript_14752:121-1809(-)